MSKRYLLFYVVSLALVVLGFQAIARQGEQLRAAPALEGDYRSSGPAQPLGRLQLRQSGHFVHAELSASGSGPLRLSGSLEGDRLRLDNPRGEAGLPTTLLLTVRPGDPMELRFGSEVLRRQPRSAIAEPSH